MILSKTNRSQLDKQKLENDQLRERLAKYEPNALDGAAQ